MYSTKVTWRSRGTLQLMFLSMKLTDNHPSYTSRHNHAKELLVLTIDKVHL